MLLMTETNLDLFHAQLLAPQDAPAMDQLCAACGTPGRPRYRRAAADQCRSGGLCRNRHVTGRHGHAAHVWAKAVWRSRCAQLALGGRPGHCAGTARLYRAVPAGAALFGHGAGAGQTALRQLPYLGRPAADPHPGTARNYAPNIWHLALPCAPWCRWTASSCWCLRPTPRWAAAARCAAYTCRTPPCRAFWSAAAPWQILAGINRALSSACGEWNKETDACRRFL